MSLPDLVYANTHISGGISVGIAASLSACRQRCIDGITTVCGAFDYTVNGRCYLHGGTTSCNELRTIPGVTHVKVTDCPGSELVPQGQGQSGTTGDDDNE